MRVYQPNSCEYLRIIFANIDANIHEYYSHSFDIGIVRIFTSMFTFLLIFFANICIFYEHSNIYSQIDVNIRINIAKIICEYLQTFVNTGSGSKKGTVTKYLIKVKTQIY